MKLSADTRNMYVNLIITAIEHPYLDGWDESLVSYKWFDPRLDGGTAEPGPDGTANAYAVWRMEDGTEKVFDVAAVSKARGIMRKVIAEPDEARPWATSSAEYLEEEFRKGYDEADFDAVDAMNVMQFFLFGYPVYG